MLYVIVPHHTHTQPGASCSLSQGQATPSSAEILSEALRDVQVGAKGQGEFPSGAESLLPIVSSQRERFKLRNMELETVSNFQKRREGGGGVRRGRGRFSGGLCSIRLGCQTEPVCPPVLTFNPTLTML